MLPIVGSCNSNFAFVLAKIYKDARIHLKSNEKKNDVRRRQLCTAGREAKGNVLTPLGPLICSMVGATLWCAPETWNNDVIRLARRLPKERADEQGQL